MKIRKRKVLVALNADEKNENKKEKLNFLKLLY